MPEDVQSADETVQAAKNDREPSSTNPQFWRGYRVTKVGGTVYLENEAGVEAFSVDQAEAYALAIIGEIHGGPLE